MPEKPKKTPDLNDKDTKMVQPEVELKPKRVVIDITDEEWFDPMNKGCCA